METFLSVEVSAVDGGHLVAASGEVDTTTAPRLAEALVQFGGGTVTLDLTDVTFLNSSGLKALVAAHRHLERSGCELRVQGEQDSVRRVLEVAGLYKLLHSNGDHPRTEVRPAVDIAPPIDGSQSRPSLGGILGGPRLGRLP
jgi:stage II sporulation protein AA (anti-sigma F factor antagonist)